MSAGLPPVDARILDLVDVALARLEPCSVRAREFKIERRAITATAACPTRVRQLLIVAATARLHHRAATIARWVAATTACRDRKLSAVQVRLVLLRTAAGTGRSHRQTKTIVRLVRATVLRGLRHSEGRARQRRQRIAADSDHSLLRREVNCHAVDQAATAAIGTALRRVPLRSAATQMASGAGHLDRSSTCGSPSCAVHRMVEVDTHAVDTAPRAMADLAECRAIRGRVTAAVLPGQRLATEAVATRRRAAEDTTVAEAAVTPVVEVEATPAVVAGGTPAAVDMADIARLHEQFEVNEVTIEARKGVLKGTPFLFEEGFNVSKFSELNRTWSTFWCRRKRKAEECPRHIPAAAKRVGVLRLRTSSLRDLVLRSG